MGTSPAETPKPSADSGTNDRRIALRRNVVDSHLVTVDLAFQTGALVLDLSESGMGVQALSSAPMGATTSLQFDLPETGGRVDAVGRIAWTDSSGRLGIRFEEMAELCRVHLAQWLSRDRRQVVAAGPNVATPSWPPPHARDEIAALRRDLTTEKLEGDAALAFVVERVRNVTRATGSAIALEDGGVVVCRASSGNAPGIGAPLDPNSGLSGECIRSGEIVRCEDTETDPRADRLVCRKLELRSIIIVPIRIQGRPAGVLEAFSSRAHAFQSSDVLLLRRVADLVAGIAVRQPETAAPSITGPQALMAAATLQPLVHEPNPAPETPLMMDHIFVVEEEVALPPAAPVVTKPQPPSRPERIVAAPPSPPQPRMEDVVKAEPVAASLPPPRVAVPVQRPLPPPAAAAPVERRAPATTLVAPVERPAPTFVARVEPRAPTPVATVEVPKVRPAVVTPVALAAPQAIKPEEVEIPATRSFVAPPPARDIVAAPSVATAGVRAMGAPADAAAATSAAARPRPVPADLEDDEVGDMHGPSSMRDAMLANMPLQVPSPWRLRLTGAGILVAVLVVGGWQVWRAIAPPKGTPLDSEINHNKAVPNTPAPVMVSTATEAPPPVAPVSASPVNISPVAKAPPPVGLAKPANPPAAAKNVPAQSVAAPVARGPETTPAPLEVAKVEVPETPPAMGLERPAGPSAISTVLSAPVASPTLDTPVVSHLTGGKLIKRFDPIYPTSAAGLLGQVVLKATVDKKGTVSRVEIVSGHAVLAQAAVSAVRRWRYEPFLLNGVPIEIESTIVVNFRAPGEQH
jgi:TonB family protein